MKFVFHLVTGSFFAFAKFADENFIFFHKERTTFFLSQIPVFLKVRVKIFKKIPVPSVLKPERSAALNSWAY